MQIVTEKQKNPDMPLQTALDIQGDKELSHIDLLTTTGNATDLNKAFEMFSSMSEKLSTSYHLLERKVVDLSGQLASVTEKRLKELSEKEKIADKLSTLLELLPGGVIVLNRHGLVEDINPEAITLLDTVKTDVIGRKWCEIIKECFDPKVDDGHEISTKSGRRVTVSTRSLECEPGQLILMTDQTVTRNLQDRLNHHQRLSAMGKMVGALAHQVRTPLSSALLYASNLAEQDLNEAQQKKFALKTLKSLQQIEQQVRDMLSFVRGETKIEDTVFVSEVIEQSVGQVNAKKIESKSNIHLNLQEDVFIRCNQSSLIGAVSNLINNAIEAAGANTNVHINVYMQDKQVCIEVKDEGPGIPEVHINKVTEAFFTTKSQGTGLGLSVVHAVARAHHGSFTIVNGDQGAIATIKIPVFKGE